MDFANMGLTGLMAQADAKRRELGYNQIECCAIVNAKSGRCGEDCAYCAQSVFHTAQTSVYPLKSATEIMLAAKRACDIGARRFGIVTSGNALTAKEIDALANVIAQITATLPLKVCASLGALHVKQLYQLKTAGLSRYHHNIETAPSHYPAIVSTHSFTQRLETIAKAQDAGLEVCCGGILGLGESWEQRQEFAETLNSLNPNSVPLNFLIPVPGTRIFGQVPPLSANDVLRVLAMIRLRVQRASIRLCAGRENVLGPRQKAAFAAGASGLLIGGYLTVNIHNLQRDHELVQAVNNCWRQGVSLCI